MTASLKAKNLLHFCKRRRSLLQMFETEVLEFPFVSDLPKREKSRLQKLWDRFAEVRRITDRKGTLLPYSAAAALLGVSRQRIAEYASDGRLEKIVFHGHPMVCENDLIELARTERKAGRPLGPNNVKEVLQASVRAGVDCYREAKAERAARIEKTSK